MDGTASRSVAIGGRATGKRWKRSYCTRKESAGGRQDRRHRWCAESPLAGRGKGKSGGYRVISYFGGDDVPVFLLNVFAKGDKVNLSKAERNELKRILKRPVKGF